MHQRKQRMAEEADAFLALPGGLGTLEELAEITTWAQLGIDAKPVGVLDLDGFWQPLLAFLDGAVESASCDRPTVSWSCASPTSTTCWPCSATHRTPLVPALLGPDDRRRRHGTQDPRWHRHLGQPPASAR